jgi:salicylate hydroxylase
MRAFRISIVGGGLGGLTAAALLQRQGHDVTVFEQAPALGEIGAGVQIGPNAMKVFRALGVDREVIGKSVEAGQHVLRSWNTGHTLFATKLKGTFETKFGAGYYQIHRADLLDILRRCFPEERVRLGAKCVAARNGTGCATLEFMDGRRVDSDVVIGADGIHSIVRESLFGPDKPRFTGNICWRGIVPASALPPGHVARDVNVWLGPHGHVVHYFVRGGELLNFVAMYEEDSWRTESWTTPAERSELLTTYAGWNADLLRIFAEATRVNKWALYDRDPLPRWSLGRMTLIGDAAHPMLPYLAQGACMAVEDGVALSRWLSDPAAPADPVAALRGFEAMRRPRTSRVQLEARARAQVNHLASPLQRLIRDARLAWRRLFDRQGTSYQIDWVYAYDVTTAPLEAVRP